MTRRLLRELFLGAALACGVMSGSGASADSSALDDLLTAFHARYGFAGVTAAIALPDGQIVTAAAGLADIEAGRAMTPDTPMLAASVGKTFVAATVLLLDHDGALSLEDPVAAHIGGTDWFARLPNHATMTLHNLLRHTAGLPDHVHLKPFQAEMAERIETGRPAPSPGDAIAFVLDTDPLFDAGAGWSYSDTGYLLLGLVIERASGQDYCQLVKDRFLDPLDLADTRPSDTPVLPGLAVGYAARDNAFGLPRRTVDADGTLLWDPAVEWTGGGLVSTSSDLAAWGQALFTGRAMAAPYLDRLLDAIPVATVAPGVFYGAGVAIYADTPRGPVYGHGGWIPGYVSSLRHYADHRVSVAFQINTDVGIADDSTDLVPALEAALADLAIEWAQEGYAR